MSKSALKRARMAACDARMAVPMPSTHYVRTVKHATVKAGATLSGNFAKGNARQTYEADQRDALECSRVVTISYPAPGDHEAHAAYVALVETKFGACHAK